MKGGDYFKEKLISCDLHRKCMCGCVDDLVRRVDFWIWSVRAVGAGQLPAVVLGKMGIEVSVNMSSRKEREIRINKKG